MKIEPPSIESVTVVLLVCVLAVLMISGCASRVPAPDTRTDTEKRLEQLEFYQRIQQMTNILST